MIQVVKLSSYQGVINTNGINQVSIDSFKKYFLPRVKIENYDIKIDGKIFYNQLINDSSSNMTKSEKYQEGKVMITQMSVY